jgi:hypothetical protein
MLSSRKMAAVASVIGLVKPRLSFVASILSRRTTCPSRSDLTRLVASSFSSSDSQRAVSGRSVSVTNAIRETPIVIIPSMTKIIRHPCKDPRCGNFKMAEASNPPMAPLKGAMVIHKPRRNVSSDRRYHLDNAYAHPGITPASKIPRRKRTAHACDRVFTNAVAIDTAPKPKVVRGRNQPGPTRVKLAQSRTVGRKCVPINLQQIVAGISKIMYEM